MHAVTQQGTTGHPLSSEESSHDTVWRDEFGSADARTQALARRLTQGLSITLGVTACLMMGEGIFSYSRTPMIPAIQFSTMVILAILVRNLRRNATHETVIGIGWIATGVLCFGTALIGVFDQEVFTTSCLVVALAATAATLLPWGGGAQLGAVLPMAAAYAYLLCTVETQAGWGLRLPFGVVSLLVASVYIAHHLEFERNSVTSERRRREAENGRLLAELKRANETKSEFVATMSHELRTPLNVILGYNELLADGTIGDPTAEQMEALGRIRANALELLELVNATLDLNRIEAGSMPVHAQVFRLSELANDMDAQVRMLVAPGVDLRWQLPPEPSWVCGDVAKLKVVLKNLTTNALKFTKRGSVVVRFAISDDAFLVEVTDTGIGMTADAAQVVFEPFQQADTSIQRDFGGAGLGLHIVKRLVSVMGGTIAVESQPGIGTTMRVHLPQLQQVEQPAA